MDHPPLTRGIRWKLLTTMVGLIVVLVVFLSARHILSETDILERALERRVALQKEVLVARGRALAETITRQAENDIAAFNFSNLAEMLNQRVYWDVYYITHWSVWLDVQITLSTLRQIIRPPPTAR